MDLANKHCVPCAVGCKKLSHEEIKKFMPELPGWMVFNLAKLHKEFSFANFKESLDFVNKVGELAEAEGHHPAILILYNKVRINVTTEAMGGLSENDFILAAKIDRLSI